jgi:kynurenine formamidase
MQRFFDLSHTITDGLQTYKTNLASLLDEGCTFNAVPPKIQGVGTFPVRACARLG